MFASNYPVDSLRASFDAIYSAFDEITRGFSSAERRALFHEQRCSHLPDGVAMQASPFSLGYVGVRLMDCRWCSAG